MTLKFKFQLAKKLEKHFSLLGDDEEIDLWFKWGDGTRFESMVIPKKSLLAYICRET